MPVNSCVNSSPVLLTLWNSAVKCKTLWMQMLTDEYLTRLFIKHGTAQHGGGAGEGESLSVSAERTAGRWQAATGPAKHNLYSSRTANNVVCARDVHPVAASDEPSTVTFRPSADGVTHGPVCRDWTLHRRVVKLTTHHRSIVPAVNQSWGEQE